MLFNFTVELNDNDYLEFNKNHLRKSTVNKKSEKFLRIFLIVFAVFVAIYMLMTNDSLKDNVLTTAIFLLLFSVCIFIIYLTLKPFMRMIEHYILKLHLKSEKPSLLKSAIQFYEDFIFSVDEKSEEKIKYTALTKLDIDKNAVYVYIDTNKAYIIPLRYFENQEHINAFCAFINSKLQEAKNSQ